MKKALLFFLFILALIAKAQDSDEYFVYEDIKYHCLTDSTVEVAKMRPVWPKYGNIIADSAMRYEKDTLNIPETVYYKDQAYIVTEIAPSAFIGTENIVSLYLPERLEYIGDGAFVGCTLLKCINIPNTVRYIGGYAFGNCDIQVPIHIPSSVEFIGDCAFGDHNKLRNKISFDQSPGNPLSIGEDAFYGYAADTLKIPERTTSVGHYAFRNVKTNVLIIPSTIRHIGKEAFACSANTVLCYMERPVDVSWQGTNTPSGVFGTYPFGQGWTWRPPVNLYLYVPDDAVETFKENDFWYYVAGIFPLSAYDPNNCKPPVAGIDMPQEDADMKEVARYNSSGRRISSPQQGMNIIVMSNGETRKEYIR